MAVITLKNIGTKGFDLSALDIADLLTYDDAKLTKTSAKFFDDSKNYTLLTGTNFGYVTSNGSLTDVTSGTITAAELAVAGTKVLSVSDLNITAAQLFDYYVAADAKGALNYLLRANDTINGTRYGDVLYGARGNDTINGNAGNDKILGGLGNDTLKGGAGNDAISGDSGVDKAYGGAGNDTLRGGYGNDTLFGQDGNDKLFGDSNADTLDGGNGNDTLSGGFGDDTLYGGAGADILSGNNNRDTFVFKSKSDSTVAKAGRDTITDFKSGQDRIDLKAIDANDKIGGDQAFAFKGAVAFSKVAGELIYKVSGGNAFVYGDTDGNGNADFAIVLDGTKALSGSDFIL